MPSVAARVFHEHLGLGFWELSYRFSSKLSSSIFGSETPEHFCCFNKFCLLEQICYCFISYFNFQFCFGCNSRFRSLLGNSKFMNPIPLTSLHFGSRGTRGEAAENSDKNETSLSYFLSILSWEETAKYAV